MTKARKYYISLEVEADKSLYRLVNIHNITKHHVTIRQTVDQLHNNYKCGLTM